jgi:negative regulator of flagellin synthesis FlgM
MRVSGESNGLGVSRTLGEAKPAAAPQAALPTGAPSAVDDAVVVSTSAQFFAFAQAQIAGIPDVRQDKVEALKALMDADEYHPDPEAVAEGLVREHTAALRE